MVYTPSSAHGSSMMEFLEATLRHLLTAYNLWLSQEKHAAKAFSSLLTSVRMTKMCRSFCSVKTRSLQMECATGREISVQEQVKSGWSLMAKAVLLHQRGYLPALSDPLFLMQNRNSTHPTAFLLTPHAPCLPSRLAHSLCMMGSISSHLPTLTSLLQACVQNCLLLAIWQLTSATSFQHGPPPFLRGLRKKDVNFPRRLARYLMMYAAFPHG